MEIIASPLLYFSQSDEDAFFSWLKSIPCVKGFHGVGISLIIDLDETRLDRECLSELLALFFRFGNDMSVFQKISEIEGLEWMCNKDSYWYTRVFGLNT